MLTQAGRMLGRYRLEAPLGQGGMAEVWRATDTKLARTVAVKVILPQHARDPHFIERFLREARLVASLEHPGILPVYDFGEEDASVYLVMPYVDGGTLRDRMTGTGVPLAQAVSWIGQLADALDAAHAAGVLHRDVKPANVLVGRTNRLALADFGIAKMLEHGAGLTATGVVVGTPVYMAPEQAQGRPASAASDRYALAVLAWELLAGRPPFEGESALALMHQHVTTPAPLLSTIVRGLPAGLDAVFESALSKSPDERPATCRALADAIAACAPTDASARAGDAAPVDATRPTLLQPVRPPSVAMGTPRPSTPPAVAAPEAGGKRRALALLGIGVALAAGALFVLSRTRPPATERTAADPSATETAGPAPSAAAPAPSDTSGSRAPTDAGSTRAASAATAVPTTTAATPTTSTAIAAAANATSVTPAPRDAAREAPSRAAAGSRAAEPDGEQPGGELREAHRRLDPARAGHRPTREDFAFALAAAQRAAAEAPARAEGRFLAAYARAGLAYLDGREVQASLHLAEALFAGRRLGSREARRLAMLAAGREEPGPGPAWALAVALGDPRRTAGPLVESAVGARPDDARPRLARALLREIEGDDDAALRDAEASYGISRRPAQRAAAAELAGEELVRAGRQEEAVVWLSRAVDAAPGEGAGRLALHAARLVRAKLGDAEAARGFLRRACDAGAEEACREIGAPAPAAPTAGVPEVPTRRRALRRLRPGT